MTSKKIHKLDGNHELPFYLIALSCPESLLKTVWGINSKLQINLKESATPITNKENPTNTFPAFIDFESVETISFCLISNKSAGILLVKELPNIDYILEITGSLKSSELQRIIKTLKEINGVVAAIEVAPSKIKRNSAFNPL